MADQHLKVTRHDDPTEIGPAVPCLYCGTPLEENDVFEVYREPEVHRYVQHTERRCRKLLLARVRDLEARVKRLEEKQ